MNLDFRPCPCCKAKTFATRYLYDICPVCGWEDDPDTSEYSSNHMSLEEAQNNYQRDSACKEHWKGWTVTEEQFDLAVDLELVWIREDGEFDCLPDWRSRVKKMIPPH